MARNGPNKTNMSKSEQRKVIAGVLITVLFVSRLISEWLFYVIFVALAAYGIAWIYRKFKQVQAGNGNLTEMNQRATGVAQPRLNLSARSGVSVELPGNFEKEVDELRAPDVVKYKLLRLGAESGATTLADLMTYEKTPEVIKKYITKGSDGPKIQGFDEDGCHVSDDILYDPDEYESVSEEDVRNPDTILLNGKPVKIKEQKSPFAW